MRTKVCLGAVYRGERITRVDWTQRRFWTGVHVNWGPGVEFELVVPEPPVCICHPAKVWQGHLLNCPVSLWRTGRMRRRPTGYIIES